MSWTLEYWHIGEMAMRFRQVTPRIVNGEKRCIMVCALSCSNHAITVTFHRVCWCGRQAATVLQAFKDALFTELFPGREMVPKTLIFAKDDSHAEDIVHLVREVFGKGNGFCKKITYQSKYAETGKAAKGEDLIQQFRTSLQLRIAVTVDMIATGTHIKPLECLLFLRDVRSHVYFEQMKGRWSA